MAKRHNTGQKIITHAAKHMRNTQHQIKEEQDQLLALMNFLQENQESFDFTFDNLPALVQASLESETLSVQTFNQAVAANKAAGCSPHFGVRTHKLLEILEGTKELATEQNIGRILDGTYAAGYDNSVTKSLPIIAEKNGFWGTSKPTFSTTLMQVMSHVIMGMPVGVTEHLATLHTFQLPKEFDATLLVKSSLFINIDGPSVALTIPHSGYSFGGDRLNSKEFRPQDCTSFLEMTAQLPENGASTADLYLAKRVLSKQSLVVVDESWLESAGGQMVKLFDVNQGAPKPGDIWACRKFSEARPIDSSLGCGGHAGIYLGRDKENVVTLAYNRDMPHMEGFGVESRATEHKSSSTKDPFLLTRRDTDFTPSREAVYPFKNLSDIAGLTAFVDAQITKESSYSPVEEPELELSGAEECIGYGD